MSALPAWLGIWSLAAAWLLLVDFFLPSDARGWAFAAAGLLLLILAARRVRWQRLDPWRYLLALPLVAAALLWPWPYRAGPLLCLGGLLLALPFVRPASGRAAPPRRLGWLAPLSLGLCLAGAAWIAQDGAVLAYWWLAARYHEAPFLTPLLYVLAQVLGWIAGSSGGSLFLPNIAEMVQATTTWERLGLLPVMLLAAGSLPLLPTLRRSAHRSGRHFISRLASALILGAAYLLFRYLALTAVLAVTRNPTIFWLPLSQALTFLPLALLLVPVLPLERVPAGPLPWSVPRSPWRYAALAGLFLLAGLALVGLLLFPDPGRQKAGRVLLDEYNSNWEWTTQALDTEWYGQKSGYNYYSLGQWLKYYYRVETNFEPRTPELLSGYDVLIVKTPTAPFTPEEIEAIDAWVRQGGGLFLIGDHTNVFGTSSYLNPLARRFGLRFRYDSTYDLPTLRVTLYEAPGLLAHPIVLDMPPFLFATSCTLEAPFLADNVMVGYGLRALSVDYSRRVFFPDKETVNDYPFGLFLQSAAVGHGRGRVVAFTDSTVFSNFTMFIAGKSEYFLGAMNWLNYEQRWPWLDGFLAAAILLCGAVALYLARDLDLGRVLVVASGALLLAASLGPWACFQVARARYSLPQPHTAYTAIAFEAEHSRLLLPTTPLSGASADVSMQTFYVWTQRLGYVPSLAPTLEEALARGSVAVVVNPFLPFQPAEVEAAARFVERGGRLLVIADPRSQAGSGQAAQIPTVVWPANQLLAPFGLGLSASGVGEGAIYNAAGQSLDRLQVGGAVVGGQPLLTLEGQVSVAALALRGEGLVAAVSFSQPFADREMGTTATVPNAHQRFIYDLEFWLFRSLVDGRFEPLHPDLGE